MTKITFLVNVEQPETRLAELRDGRLFNIDVEREGRLLGDIYKARVENILPGMDAAFVNIGLERNALIYAGDIVPRGAATHTAAISPTAVPSVESLLHVGDEILVQIARPPQGSKGARVTGRISLPGRFVILVEHGDNVGVSRRIPHEEERLRLRRLAEKLRPLDHGLIVRTEAEGVSEAELVRDVDLLRERLRAICEQGRTARAPRALHLELGLLGRLARDRLTEEVDAVIIDAEELYDDFRSLLQLQSPQFTERVKLHRSPVPLFTEFGVEEDIQRAQKRTVQLPHGSLTFDETEALTAIDVNTGKFVGKSRLADTVLTTNLEAVEEAARQIRLRDIGGVVVIDFIDMERNRDRIKVMNALEAALGQDRTRTRIVQLSPSGLVEITRRREGHSLRQLLHEACPYCSGDGVIHNSVSVALGARRQVREFAAARPGCPVEVTLHPEVGPEFLGQDAQYVSDLERDTGCQIWLRVEPSLHLEACQVEAARQRELSGPPSPGKRLYLPEGTPLYPPLGPHYAVMDGLLLFLEIPTQQEQLRPSPPLVVEVTKAGRWFINGRVLTSSGEKVA